MRREESHQRRWDRHGHNRDLQRPFPAKPIADTSEKQATDGTNEVAGGEHAEGIDETRNRIVGGEELCTDHGSEEAENGEVVPLKPVADGTPE